MRTGRAHKSAIVMTARGIDHGRAHPAPFPATLPNYLSRSCRSQGEPSPIRKLIIENSQKPSNSTIVAAWALVVSLHCLVEDVVIGICADESTHSALSFRIQAPSGDATVSDFVSSVQASLDKLLATISKREPPEITVDVRHDGDEASGFPSCLDLRSHTCTNSTPEVVGASGGQAIPLHVKCYQSPSGTEVSLRSDETMMTSAWSRSLLAQFRLAIIALSSNPQMLLRDIGLLDESGLEQLESWTQAPEAVATQPLLHKVIEEQAHLRPLAVAVGETDSVMTYAELDMGASALAKHIIAVQSAQNTVGNVIVMFSKSALAILAMLAVLKAGGAFVPVDTQWPVGRIEKVIANTENPLVLCSEDQHPRLESITSVKALSVTASLLYKLKRAPKHGDSPPLPLVRSDAPAYIMHTSGSTGQPKGIVITHRSITTSINAMARYFNTSTSTRTLQFSAFTFDVSVCDIWTTLCRGGRVCMPSEEQRFNLTDFVLAERCNNAFITPSAAATIDPDVPKNYMSRLSVIGEAVKPEFLRKYAPTTAGEHSEEDFVLCDTWGPTEASVFTAGSRPIVVDANGSRLSQRAGNVGRSIGCSLFIVSAQNPHVLSPPYAPGEIALLGPTLSTGYWGDDAKTNDAFRTDLKWAREKRWRDKFGEQAMQRVYLTGDIGRYSEHGDGSVVFMHRRGGYVKVNGLRIEPGEVESAVVEVGSKLSEATDVHVPSWTSNVVCVLDRVVGGVAQQLLVCFIAENDQAEESGALTAPLEVSQERRSLLQDLSKGMRHIVPEYMMPRLFVSVARMPFTVSFKLDRNNLLASIKSMDWMELIEKYSVEDTSQ